MCSRIEMLVEMTALNASWSTFSFKFISLCKVPLRIVIIYLYSKQFKLKIIINICVPLYIIK